MLGGVGGLGRGVDGRYDQNPLYISKSKFKMAISMSHFKA